MTELTADSSSTTGLNAFRPRILHTAYFVADIERSLKFYRDVLGMREQQRFEIGNGVAEVVMTFPDSKGAGVILMWNTQRTTPYQYGDSYSRLVMLVTDLDASVRHLRAQRVRFSKEPADVGTMRYCIINDPDGYAIEVLQIKR